VSLPLGLGPARSTPASVQTPILILGLAGLSMHHGALGVMRSAGRLGIPVFHAQPGRRTPIGCSRYSRGGLVLPPGAGEDRVLALLREFAARHGRAILLAVDDASAMFVADHSDVLSEAFLFPAQTGGLARALADKRTMHGLCLEHAIPTPSVVFPASEADVRAHAADAVFPVVAKRIDASQPTTVRSTPNVLVASDREELLAAYRSMESPRLANVMLQEYIPGTPASNWMFNGYFDSRSECGIAFTGQKIRQSPPDAGATTLGVCLASPLLEETTRRFMRAVGYQGILDADYRLDRRDGQYKLLDVNPRIGSSFRLFVAADGTDVLRALYLDLTGEHVPMPAPASPADAAVAPAGAVPAATTTAAAATTTADSSSSTTITSTTTAQLSGRRWLVEPQDLRSCMAHVRRRELTVGAWLRSLRHIDEVAWWARDDPLPFLSMSTSLLSGRLRRRLGARRARGAPRQRHSEQR
jgi:D-aspartate ligase